MDGHAVKKYFLSCMVISNTFSPEPTGHNELLKGDGWPVLTRHDDILQVLPPLTHRYAGF